jgi:hypothetical protein
MGWEQTFALSEFSVGTVGSMPRAWDLLSSQLLCASVCMYKCVHVHVCACEYIVYV